MGWARAEKAWLSAGLVELAWVDGCCFGWVLAWWITGSAGCYFGRAGLGGCWFGRVLAWLGAGLGGCCFGWVLTRLRAGLLGCWPLPSLLQGLILSFCFEIPLFSRNTFFSGEATVINNCK